MTFNNENFAEQQNSNEFVKSETFDIFLCMELFISEFR